MSAEETPPGHHRYKGVLLDNTTPVDHVERCLTAKYLPTDVFVVSYPRSGTLLTQEIVWHIMNRSTIALHQAHESLNTCFPFLELYCPEIAPDPLEALNGQVDGEYRLIKSHLNEHILYPAIQSVQPKIILILRNAKDVMVSEYEFYRTCASYYDDWPHNWANFFENFIKSNVWYGNYLDWCQGWLKRKNLSNIFIVHYEDLVMKKYDTIKCLAEFLGQGGISESEIDIIIKNTDFKAMQSREQPDDPDFGPEKLMRKGKTGAWRSHFTEEQSVYIDSLIEKCFKDVNINTD